MPSGARKKQDITAVFYRLKLAEKIEGNCLYLEDPSYKYYGGFPTGWFYGTKSTSFAMLAFSIVENVRESLDISVEDVCFVGSSSGGFNALYFCDLMVGSSAICDNPQFYLRHSKSHRKLEEIANLKISDPDPMGRADVARIIDNQQSRFYIEINKNSQHDYDLQLQTLMREKDFTLKEGINRFGSSIIVVHPFDYSKPHHTFSSVDEFLNLVSILHVERSEEDLQAGIATHLDEKQARLRKMDTASLSNLAASIEADVPTSLDVDVYKGSKVRVRGASGQITYIVEMNEAGSGAAQIALYLSKAAFNESILREVKGDWIKSRTITANTFCLKSGGIKSDTVGPVAAQLIAESLPQLVE